MHCILHEEALASTTLTPEMKENWMSIDIVNCVKAGTLNSCLFKLLCQDMQSAHIGLLLHTNFQWLSKGIC